MEPHENPPALASTFEVSSAGVRLGADVVVPEAARGIVLFAHGSGSSRFSPRNRAVAQELQVAGFATVLADLLTAEEERSDAHRGHLRFDIGLLAERLTALVDWASRFEHTAGLAVGLFGASTGAAAALSTAAQRPEGVAAVVSRGGRPDLAGDALARVRQPVVLIVGERDSVVVDLNRGALERLAGETQLCVVPGATHLFEEPGALDQVSALARDWFFTHLSS